MICWEFGGINYFAITEAGIIGTEKVKAAMLAVDRAKYCHKSDPYQDCPRQIGYNVTISAPHMVELRFLILMLCEALLLIMWIGHIKAEF